MTKADKIISDLQSVGRDLLYGDMDTDPVCIEAIEFIKMLLAENRRLYKQWADHDCMDALRVRGKVWAEPCRSAMQKSGGAVIPCKLAYGHDGECEYEQPEKES